MIHLKSVFSFVAVLTTLGAIVLLCAFKVSAPDFWWHVKAGEVMWESLSLIHIDPFSYPRAGEEYLATHEWLAQLIIAGVFNIGGSTGAIALRTIAMVLLSLLFFFLGKKHIVLSSILSIWSTSFLIMFLRVRPQLFTFVFFLSFLTCLFVLLDRPKLKKWIIPLLILLEILWVNMHGGAALLGPILFGAFALQQIWSTGRIPQWILCTFLGLIFSFFVSPTPFENITYVTNLFTDQTVQFIREWQPRVIEGYVKNYSLLWILAIGTLLYTKRKCIFSALILLGIGYLSLRAIRHEPLFIMAAVGLILYQVSSSKITLPLKRLYIPINIVISIVIIWFAYQNYMVLTQRHYLRGYGSFEPIKDSYEFIEKENLTGNMFNTYGDGSYLLYRGYPDRKNFVDGRNIDHGFSFMQKLFRAAQDANTWDVLDDTYNFSYAVVGYESILAIGDLPYSAHLNRSPNWSLVYIDDFSAVYVKNIEANKEVIKKYAYTLLTPEILEYMQVSYDMEEELLHVTREDLVGIKGLRALSKIYLAQGKYDEVHNIVLEMFRRIPENFEAYEILGQVSIKEEKWEQAYNAYVKAAHLGSYVGVELNKELLKKLRDKY
jgi:tetratricopeptide (TPR) repeat protein